MFIMTADVMCVALLIMMCALGYCVMKLCLSLINASQRIVQITEMGAREQMLVQRAADTTRGLQRNSIEVPPIYIPTNANAYAERRVTKSFSKSSFSLSILVAVHVHEVFKLISTQQTDQNG